MVNKTQSERIGRIEALKTIMRKIIASNRDIKPEEFVWEVMSKMKVNRQTANEYMKQAQYEIKHRI